MGFLSIEVSGTPEEMGSAYGSQAKEQIMKAAAFYKKFITEKSGRSWDDISKLIDSDIIPSLSSNYSEYFEEMKAISASSGVPLQEVVAINVRSELSFGLFKIENKDNTSDGCTSMTCVSDKYAMSGQNWDWIDDAYEFTIILKLNPINKPSCVMVAEAGMIGKIGMNEYGVGCLINALRVSGYNYQALPVNIAARKILESATAKEAVKYVVSKGLACSVNYMVCDKDYSCAIEATAYDTVVIERNSMGHVYHTNHTIKDHDSRGYEPFFVPDSAPRLSQIEQAAQKAPDSSFQSLDKFFEFFSDTSNSPLSVCKFSIPESPAHTLCTVTMDHNAKIVRFRFGMPCDPSKGDFEFKY
ncbi:hypothetical protein CANCADRAFT_83237 [Tortispora caseinolytica NRRL Y-17796]|uniref:Peptidase C45 hydrolase domain-containing protein n=1 Tax=Tortispora caseinolytica NRRL Y-17796 TaxID=767744 RepID=A0A1E4TKH7_9ASCO|nr:hypothetical protein CANCADRAFT_83237 [Tortispora caseinolytica NRRL Y-17796]